MVDACARQDIAVIAMKALAGGLLGSARLSFAFLRQFANVVPIWGFQRESELMEVVALEANPPALTEGLLKQIAKERRELAGQFCRGCGYCMPCPANIPINMAARMALLLRRAPWENFVTEQWQENMARIEDCVHCGHCTSHCPYGLDTPGLLRDNLAFYRKFLADKGY